MSLKTHLFAVALSSVCLAPVVALADDDEDSDYRPPQQQAHTHVRGCNHGGAPSGYAVGGGRYELRTVQKWVPGYHETVWSPPLCREKRHGRVKCRDGHYVRQWREGGYQSVQEWVLVRPQYSSVNFEIYANF